MNSNIQLNFSSLLSHDFVHSSYYLQVLSIVQILNHTFKFIECNINLRVSENNDLQSAVLFCNDFVVTITLTILNVFSLLKGNPSSCFTERSVAQ